MSAICGACLKEVKPEKALNCRKCKAAYHDICVGTSLEDMGRSRTAAWVCPACCNKIPKTDNSNTPIRKIPSPVDSSTLGKPNLSENSGLCLSRDDLTNIVRNEIRNALGDTMTSTIKTCIAAQFRELNRKVTDIESSLTFISDQYEDFKNEVQSLKPELQTLRAENTQLRSSVQELTNRLNQLEQMSRASNAELQCVPEKEGEDLVGLVQQLGAVMAHPVLERDITQCTRLAKLDPSKPRPRSILVKFSSPRIRDNFIAASRKYNKDHATDKLNAGHLGVVTETRTPIYVVEHLTKEIKALHAAARLRAKEIGYNIVWVKHGRVFLRKEEKEKHVLVKDMEALKNLK